MDTEQIIKTVASAWRALLDDRARNRGERSSHLVGYYQGQRDMAIAMGIRWSDIKSRLDEVDAEYLTTTEAVTA